MTRFVELGELTVAHSVAGSGPPLLLLHGGEASHHMFDALVPLLAPHFTTIAYDQRDCGETRNPERDCTLEDLADDAVALLGVLNGGRAGPGGHDQGRAFVYGSSFGGRVAQALALRHPERVGRVVLGSTWPLPERLDQLNAENVKQIHALRARLPETAEALIEYFLPKSFLETQPQYKALFRNVQPQSARSLRRARTIDSTMPFAPGAVQADVLLLAAELDRVVPSRITLAMTREFPQATTHLLPGAGHAAALQMPERVAEVITEFCLGHPTRA